MTTEVYSKGLYSTWLYVPEINSAFDCGEGLSTHLGPRCFGIQKLFISHGHTDHIAGIAALVGIRSCGFGNKETPLEIYYPKDCREVLAMKTFVETARAKPTYPLVWTALEPGMEISLGNPKRKVRVFRVEHGNPANLALGFSVREQRSRLSPEWVGKTQEELKNLGSAGVKLTESYEKVIWAYGGDYYSLPQSEIEGADWFFSDTTFLNVADREEKSHASLEEAVEIARKAKVRRFVGMHISPRYGKKDITEVSFWLKKNYPSGVLLPIHKPAVFSDQPNKKAIAVEIA